MNVSLWLGVLLGLIALFVTSVIVWLYRADIKKERERKRIEAAQCRDLAVYYPPTLPLATLIRNYIRSLKILTIWRNPYLPETLKTAAAQPSATKLGAGTPITSTVQKDGLSLKKVLTSKVSIFGTLIVTGAIFSVWFMLWFLSPATSSLPQVNPSTEVTPTTPTPTTSALSNLSVGDVVVIVICVLVLGILVIIKIKKNRNKHEEVAKQKPDPNKKEKNWFQRTMIALDKFWEEKIGSKKKHLLIFPVLLVLLWWFIGFTLWHVAPAFSKPWRDYPWLFWALIPFAMLVAFGVGILKRSFLTTLALIPLILLFGLGVEKHNESDWGKQREAIRVAKKAEDDHKAAALKEATDPHQTPHATSRAWSEAVNLDHWEHYSWDSSARIDVRIIFQDGTSLIIEDDCPEVQRPKLHKKAHEIAFRLPLNPKTYDVQVDVKRW